MLLERTEIAGFRGINRLSLMLEENNVLIGENAWGKSSLLDALTLLLSPHDELYHFVYNDFWFPPGDVQGREHHLHIILTFRENEPGRYRADATVGSPTAGRCATTVFDVFSTAWRVNWPPTVAC